MPDCQHLNRVYSGEAFLGIPRQWTWRCEDCFEGGTTEAAKCPQEPDLSSFADIVEKEEPGFGQMMKRRRKIRMSYSD